MLHIKMISNTDPLYQNERELRNRILLRPYGLSDYAWEMKDSHAWHFIAIKGEEVVGCVLLVPDSQKKGRGQLMQMAVEARQHHQGIGKCLIHALLSFCRTKGISEVYCHARHSAIGFYKKRGFEVYGEPFFEVGIKHRKMRYTIMKTNSSEILYQGSTEREKVMTGVFVNEKSE